MKIRWTYKCFKLKQAVTYDRPLSCWFFLYFSYFQDEVGVVNATTESYFDLLF